MEQTEQERDRGIEREESNRVVRNKRDHNAISQRSRCEGKGSHGEIPVQYGTKE
jgi:hypothetical protein